MRQPQRSSPRRRRWGLPVAGAVLALVAPALLGAAPAGASLTGPGVGPGRNITVFHNIDFVGVFGYGPVGALVRVEVIRDGVVIGAAAGNSWSTPEGPGLEVNHGTEGLAFPGDCWAGSTPDIRPGDRIVVTVGRIRDEVTVDDIRFTGQPVLDQATGDVLVRAIAKRADGTPIPPAQIDSGEFRDEDGKYRATPDVVEATAGVEGGVTMRYKKPYTGFRNRDGLTETQRRDALLLQDGHATGIGHTEVLPPESMLVDGIADVTGPAPGCENFGGDLIAPRVVSQAPAPDAREVGRRTNVSVGLSETVRGLDATSFALTGPDGPVPAAFSYNRTTGLATLNPDLDLASGTKYTATVAAGVTDTLGNALPPVGWSFITTGEGPDNDRTPPTVLTATPAADATGVARGVNVMVGFSEPVGKPGANSIVLQAADGTVVPAVLSYNATTRTAVLNPVELLAAGTSYRVVVAEGITDLAGNPLAPGGWSFTTSGVAPGGDSVVPTVLTATPAADATGVARGVNVMVGFSEPVGKPGANSIVLQAADGTVVPAVLSYNATTRTAVLNPVELLAAGTSYRVVVAEGITDLAGNPLAPGGWSFTTS